MKDLEIFRTGTHTAMSGRTLTFAEADLVAMAKAYDPAKYEAPLVVGHPKQDAPAYGWVGGLSTEGGRLRAAPQQVDAAFAELVNEGRFKKISASFYLPESPSNPVPGSYYLRHVGFLGAAAPAVKGLKSASFAEGEGEVLEFGDWSDRVQAGLWRSLRDWILAQFGQEAADKAVPGWDVNAVQEEAVQRETQPEPSYAEGEMTPQEIQAKIDAAVAAALAGKTAEFGEKETSLKARENALAAQEKQARKTWIVSFLEGVKEKVTPAMAKLGLADFLESLDADESVCFGEGEAVTKGQFAFMKGFLSALPKAIEFGEVAGADKRLPAGGTAGDKLDALVAAKRKETPTLSYGEALAGVQADHPELAEAYLAEISPART